MYHTFPTLDRRAFLGGMAFTAAALAAPGAFADELTRTVAQMEGPFYPDRLPLDTDNDLIVINENLKAGVGEVTHLTGRVLDSKGNPVKNAVVEIWQCDANGAYRHAGDTGNASKLDKNFQGFGRFTTGTTGEYYFRTIKPVPYTGRTAHIHYKIKKGGKELLTTQLYIKGNPGNARDGIWSRVTDAKLRASIETDFAPMKESKVGELAAKWDIVLGVTPEA